MHEAFTFYLIILLLYSDERLNTLFLAQTYTDEDHGIAQSRAHLYHSLENFLDECFEVS